MYLPSFKYLCPGNLSEAVDCLARDDSNSSDNSDTRLLAGGTDLLLMMKEGRTSPSALLSLKKLAELRQVKTNGESSVIGAGISIAELGVPEISSENPAIGDMVRQFASAPIRNRATVGGNICNAAPCADTPPALMVSDATLSIAGQNGPRTVPLSQFITGPRQTILRENEILVSIAFKKNNQGSAYIKFGPRKAVNIAIVGVACSLELENDCIASLKVSVTAASPAPTFAEYASVIGEKPVKEVWEKVAEDVCGALAPISDVRGSADYRLHLARVGTVRGFELALKRWKAAAHA